MVFVKLIIPSTWLEDLNLRMKTVLWTLLKNSKAEDGKVLKDVYLGNKKVKNFLGAQDVPSHLLTKI